MTQIYCDFSGYTDMARGTARMFGIALGDNFKFPFLCRKSARLLAQLAYQPVDMAARLSLHPTRW